MTTVSTAIGRIKRDLRRSYKEAVNELAGNLTDSGTSFTLAHALNTIVPGSVVEIDDELIYVLATNEGGLQVTDCIRSFDGTIAAAHSSGSIVRPNPRFPKVDIRAAIEDEIRSWEPRLFQVGTVSQTITQGSGTRAWNFTDSANYLGRILSVKLQPSSTMPFADSRPLDVKYADILGGQDTTTFASGWALVVREGNLPLGLLPTGTITVAYAKRFDLSSLADATDLETAVGIPASALDVLRYGVVYRLLAAQETQRSDMSAQDEPRRAGEVRAGDALRGAAGFKALRDERLTEEADKLNALYGLHGW